MNELTAIFADLGLTTVDAASPRKLSAKDKTINQANKMRGKLKGYTSVDALNSQTSNINWWSNTAHGSKRYVQAKYNSRIVPGLKTEVDDSLEAVIEAVQKLKIAAERLPDDWWAKEEARRIK